MPGQQQLGLQSPRRCMQLVFSPHLPQRYAYYIVSQQGIVGVPESYPGQDVVPPAAARTVDAAAWPGQTRPMAKQQRRQPAQQAPEGPQQQRAAQTSLAQPSPQQASSMQDATGAAAGGLQPRQHALQQQPAQRLHTLQHQHARAVPLSRPGCPMPESTERAQIGLQSNDSMRHDRAGSTRQGAAQPPQISLQSKQVAPSTIGSSRPQHTVQQQQPGQHLSSRPQPLSGTASVGQDASQLLGQAGPSPRETPFGVSYNTTPRPGVTGDCSSCCRPEKRNIYTSPINKLL